jgi:hypothetical protein
MQALADMLTQWKEDLYFAIKCVRQKLSKYYSEVTATSGLFPNSAHILDSFQELLSFRKWDKGMDINPDYETSYSTQYHQAFLMYVENQYCVKQL